MEAVSVIMALPLMGILLSESGVKIASDSMCNVQNEYLRKGCALAHFSNDSPVRLIEGR